MSVVFEEENFSINQKDSKTDQYSKDTRKVSMLKQITMVIIIAVCVLGTFLVPILRGQREKENIVYIEDITEARMRLVPLKDREAFIARFPSRNSE